MIIPVNLPGKPYPVVLESGGISRVGEVFDLHRRVFIATDDGVPTSYVDAVSAQCRDAYVESLPAGEQSKSVADYERVLTSMLRAGVTRSDCVVAIGGGVVGDLAGFAAGTYMRGIDYYNIPTTLLAQVDSSVGGKTALNLGGIKNAVGVFHQPRAVMIDPDVLKTLPERLVSEGMAEVIKMALTCDRELFLRLSREALPPETVIEGAVRIKAGVVEDDELDTWARRVLNFGHTLGHALESAGEGKLLHGECVALGMLPMCSAAVREQLLPVLEKFGLPTRCEIAGKKLLPYLTKDKKATHTSVCTVQVTETGKCNYVNLKPDEIIRRWEAVQ